MNENHPYWLEVWVREEIEKRMIDTEILKRILKRMKGVSEDE